MGNGVKNHTFFFLIFFNVNSPFENFPVPHLRYVDFWWILRDGLILADHRFKYVCIYDRVMYVYIYMYKSVWIV